MLSSVGIIGYGYVGKACHKVFEHNSKFFIVDPKFTEFTIQDLVVHNPEIIFIAVDAPTLDDRSVDASKIYNILKQLEDLQYKGIVILKSTLTPDIINDLGKLFGYDQHSNRSGTLRFVYSPEFLREAHWQEDAQNPAFIILGGDYSTCTEIQTIYENHSAIRRYTRFYIVTYQYAAIIKYAINSFLATKVTFMNQLYQLCTDMEGSPPFPDDWNRFVNILASDIRFGISHNKVPGEDGYFGYGGSCLPKDISALIGYDKNGCFSIIREVEEANTKIRLSGKNER